ncbi:tyrosine-type recombinase/integrase [Pseudonocardia sp. TMWB2A]|uniref:tyrosine-type recombinase/integrase n=1 Tax=Pseudonocardia sp. TMWB2A TaxID=687430 RepID=UPI00307D42CC
MTPLRNGELIEHYVRAHSDRWRPGTQRLRRIQLRVVADAIAPALLCSATEDDLYEWAVRLRGAPETRASYIAAVRGLYRWMSSRSRPRIRIDDPAAILDRPRVPIRLPRPMLDSNYELALLGAQGDPEMLTWLALAGCSGLRCCEIAWLQVTDVTPLPSGQAMLRFEGKGGKVRPVPIGTAVMRLLRPSLVKRRGPMFRRTSDGRAHTPDRVSQLINRHLRGLGIDETAHQIRHRFGSDYHREDGDVFRQARLMGHRSVDTTLGYTATEPIDAVEFIEMLTTRRLRPDRMPPAA